MFQSKQNRRRHHGASPPAWRQAHGLALLSLLGMLVLGWMDVLPARAAPDNPERISDIARPATVMVETVYDGTISIPTFNLTQMGTSQLNALLASGTPAAAWLQMYQSIANDPLDLLQPVAGEPSHISGGAMGSGFLVTPDGYLVTNAHVVKVEESLKETPAAQNAARVTQNIVNYYQTTYGGTLSSDLQTQLTSAFYKFYQQNIAVNLDSTQYYVGMGASVPGLAVMQKGFPSTMVSVGDIIPGKDVAVLKMEGSNLPTMPLGDDTTLVSGDQIYVLGYPAAATFQPLVAQQESATIPTLTAGLVSAMRPMPGGWNAIQTDAAITHGNSGGPALDAQGRVIGLATFGSIDPSTGQPVAGINFIVPVSIVKEFLNQSNITPREGMFTQLFTKGVDLYNAQHYKAALDTFTVVNNLLPGNPYVQQFITNSQVNIAQGLDQPIISPLWYAAIGLVILGAACMLYLWRRQRAPTGPGLRLLPQTPTSLEEPKHDEEQPPDDETKRKSA